MMTTKNSVATNTLLTLDDGLRVKMLWMKQIQISYDLTS
jgi:predicted transcriptional regulator